MRRYLSAAFVLVFVGLMGIIHVSVMLQFTVTTAFAEETEKADHSKTKKLPEKAPPHDRLADSKPSMTRHSMVINGKTLSYTATAGYLTLRDEAGKPEAHIFFTAYTKDGEDKQSARPVTFVFNGGPGAASVWLHLGAIGPKRAFIQSEHAAGVAPYRLVPNNETWLDLTDLVFVDPVGTGYSRGAEGADVKKLFSVKGDVEAVGEFIRLYCTKYDRWLSPKFLAGESYGTTRAAGLSGFLQDNLGMYLNGIILISSALDFQVISFSFSNDLPYILFLPTYTHAAWYHKKLAGALQANLEQTRREVEQFALTEYLVALAKGSSLSHDEREHLIDKLSAYTGLSKVYIRNANLRINRQDFSRELLRDEHLRIGTLDSRITGDYKSRDFMDDPSVFNVAGALVATWNDYARKELNFEDDAVYKFLSTKVNESWDWGSAAKGFPNVAGTLAHELAKNASLHVLIASGYFDLDTPYFGVKYTTNHLVRDPSVMGRVTMAYYDAGHQMYTHAPSLKKLKRDVAMFFKTSLLSKTEDKSR